MAAVGRSHHVDVDPHSVWLEPLVFASALLRYGTEAVMIFFVVSGFVIHLVTRACVLSELVPALPFTSSVVVCYPVWLTGAWLAEWLLQMRVRVSLVASMHRRVPGFEAAA